MTQDEVIKELHNVIAGNQNFTTWTVSTPHLVELVNRVVKAEREACAKQCESINSLEDYYGERIELACAEAIRARGEA
jgi:hypothetical protein